MWTTRLRRYGGKQAIEERRRAAIVMLSQASTRAISQKLRDEARETLKWLHEHELRCLNHEETEFWATQIELSN
jgi:hypothetical protein